MYIACLVKNNTSLVEHNYFVQGDYQCQYKISMHNNPDRKHQKLYSFIFTNCKLKPQFKKSYNFMVLNSDSKT
jgi:hypothetical protein